MTGHFVLRSTTLATAFLLFATGAAHADCVIDEASVTPSADEVLPTTNPGQEFSFIATRDCRTLIFSVQDTALTKIPTGGRGAGTDLTYRVFLTESELRSVIDESTTTLTWSITAYGPAGRFPIAEVTTTNEIDFDEDGWTRSDGDVRRCDRSSSINPGVAERCNDIDDNCSGQVDEDLCKTLAVRCWYPEFEICSRICSGGVWTANTGQCP